MPNAVTVAIDPASQRQFNDNLRKLQELTQRDMSIVNRNAARDVTRAAWKATPRSKGKFSLGDFAGNGGYFLALRTGTAGGIGVSRSGKLAKGRGTLATKWVFLPTDRKNAMQLLRQYGHPGPGSRIQGSGFARRGWLQALNRLGVTIADKPDGKRNHRTPPGQIGEYRQQLGAAPAIEVANKVPYIAKLDNIRGITASAFMSVLPKQAAVIQKLTEKTARTAMQGAT